MRSKGVGGVRRPRQASPRALAVAGVVVVAVIVAIVLGIVLSGGKKTSTGNFPPIGSHTWPGALSGATDVYNRFKGIPQSGLILGKPNAPATLTVFIDLQCPNCQIFETQQMPTIIQKYVRPGQLNIRMEPWEILDRPGGPGDSARGQAATIAAAAQNKGFQFADLLYINQGAEDSGWLNEDVVGSAASSVDGLRPQKVLDDLGSSQVKTTVSEVDSTAQAQGFGATPTILLNHKGQKAQVFSQGVPDPTQMENAIQSAIAG